MLLLLGLIASAQTGACGLAWVTPRQGEFAVVHRLGPSYRSLSVGSLVRTHDASTCSDGEVMVEVLAVNPVYRVKKRPLASVGSRGCIAADVVASVGAHRFVSQPSHPDEPRVSDLAPGTLWPPVVDTRGCERGSYRFGGHELTLQQMTSLRPIPDGDLLRVRSTVRALREAFPTIEPSWVLFSDWGRVSMPYARYHPAAERKETWEREHLVDEEQRGKGTSADGPPDGSEPAFLHFVGGDERFSDIWGEPETIIALSKLALTWNRWCGRELAARDAADREAGRPVRFSATPTNCTLQFADVAYYNAVRPDPLGHVTHFEGTCVDIRLLRHDGSHYEAFYDRDDDREGFRQGYNQALTLAFLELINRELEVERFYFNDPVALSTIRGLRPASGHDDHIHFCLK